jgi:nucleoid-associated protein YgaU
MRSSILLKLGAVLVVLAAGVASATDENSEPATSEVPQVTAQATTPELAEPVTPEAAEPTPEDESSATPELAEPVVPEATEPTAPDGDLPETSEVAEPAMPQAAPGDEAEGSDAVATDEESVALETDEEPVALEDGAAADDPEAPTEGAETLEPTLESTPSADEPGSESAEVEDALETPQPVADTGKVELGRLGYDAQGQPGRIHVVVRGDTLWHVSDAYLGTPWVWPAIWQENRDIENPHLIYPGDHIWITETEMRIITPEEVETLLAGTPVPELPAEIPDSFEPEPLAIVPPAPAVAPALRSEQVSTREAVGLVTADVYESAASVVDAFADKVMMSQGDRVYVGLGEGDVSKGDQFTVFRLRERVFDPDTHRLLGYHVDVLGWVEVEEPETEASVALIRESYSEIERGDRVIPREPLPAEIAVQPSPEGVEGKVSFFAKSRTMMGMTDYVYLNRGTLDGVEVGSPLEVYRPAYVADEVARGTKVEVPDRVIAELLVVKAQSNTSVAFVRHTTAEIELGDHFRGVSR